MNTFFLDDQTFAQFRAYIYNLTGIDYTEGKRSTVGFKCRAALINMLISRSSRCRRLGGRKL